jgi:hypothetical protein
LSEQDLEHVRQSSSFDFGEPTGQGVCRFRRRGVKVNLVAKFSDNLTAFGEIIALFTFEINDHSVRVERRFDFVIEEKEERWV